MNIVFIQYSVSGTEKEKDTVWRLKYTHITISFSYLLHDSYIMKGKMSYLVSINLVLTCTATMSGGNMSVRGICMKCQAVAR